LFYLFGGSPFIEGGVLTGMEVWDFTYLGNCKAGNGKINLFVDGRGENCG